MSMLHTRVTTVDLLRHGQVATSGLFCAPPDEPLSTAGWQQLTTTTAQAHADGVISSPSRRCHEFAVHWATPQACPLHADAAFQEMQFGRWVGQSTQAIWASEADLLQQLWQQPEDFVAPEGEAFVAFAARVRQGWQAVLQQYAGQRVLLCTHGGVIRVILGQVLGMPYVNTQAFEVGYGTAVRLRVYADGAASVYGLGVRTLVDSTLPGLAEGEG